MWRQSANHSLSLRWAQKTAPWEFQTKLLHYFFTSNNKSNLHFTLRIWRCVRIVRFPGRLIIFVRPLGPYWCTGSGLCVAFIWTMATPLICVVIVWVGVNSFLGGKIVTGVIDWFGLWGWRINKGAIFTRTAPLFWNFISLFQGSRTRLVRKIGSQNHQNPIFDPLLRNEKLCGNL